MRLSVTAKNIFIFLIMLELIIVVILDGKIKLEAMNSEGK